MTANIKLVHICNFCNKNSTQVRTLVSGNGVFICNECIELCNQALQDQQTEARPPSQNIAWTPTQVVDYLDKHVIGQQLAKKTLGVAIYNHLKRLNYPQVDQVVLDKSNILMIGSSGVGKSHMVSTLAKILDVPFAVVDATSLSQTGYVGLDPEECLVRLYQAADNNMESAEKGIVFIDEIDKISRKSGENTSTTRDVSGEGVQQALLKIIEGSMVKFQPNSGRKNPNGEFLTMNTRNILFILGGAFEGLHKLISNRLQDTSSQMGFNSQLKLASQQLEWQLIQQVETEDLINYGLIPELVGRIPVILPFENLDLHTLTRILVEPQNSIVAQFQKLFELEGIDLVFESAALTAIAQQVLQSQTGARGLRRVIERLLLNSQYQIVSLKQQQVKQLIVTAQCVTMGVEPKKVID